jgi:tRNA modification GTPase
MLAQHQDPIIAIATAAGRGSVGIVRISGKGLAGFIALLLGRNLSPREATYLSFCDSQGDPIDQGLAIFFPGPHSFTGEDVLELQAHGGLVVLQLLLARCLEVAAAPVAQVSPAGHCCLPGLRIARAGEFTQRAFLNDKIDLAQAEAIADLIDASTEAAARGASQSLSGAFSKEVHGLRDGLVRLRMLVEATLDFPEEEIEFLQKADAQGQLERLQRGLDALLQKAAQGALLREGVKVVIAGQPNAGKSSLLNALAGAELAIVTPIAGTTRDRVEQTIQIEGVPVHVVDTAGLRHSEDAIEKIGIERAWTAIEEADAVLFLHDLTRANATEYIAVDADIARVIALKVPKTVPVIDVWNKSDAAAPVHGTGLVLSAKTGTGLDDLRQALLQAAGWQAPSGGVFIARARHTEALRKVGNHLRQADSFLASQVQSLDLLAEELRLAQTALSEITGEFSSDDLLGVIFSQFCIGK